MSTLKARTTYTLRIQTSDGCDFTADLEATKLSHLKHVVAETYPEAVGWQVLKDNADDGVCEHGYTHGCRGCNPDGN